MRVVQNYSQWGRTPSVHYSHVCSVKIIVFALYFHNRYESRQIRKVLRLRGSRVVSGGCIAKPTAPGEEWHE